MQGPNPAGRLWDLPGEGRRDAVNFRNPFPIRKRYTIDSVVILLKPVPDPQALYY
jgi:hypothetical protein